MTVALTASGVANGDYTIAMQTGAGINTGVALNTSNPYSRLGPQWCSRAMPPTRCGSPRST